MNKSPAYIRYYRRGLELYDGGHYQEALFSLKKSLVCKPDFPDIYYLIARIYTELKHYIDALSMYEKLVQFLPNDLEILCDYGKTLLMAGQEKKGIRVLKKSLKHNPAEARARNEIVRYCLRNNKPKQALAYSEMGIKALPEHPLFYCFAGDALRKLGKFQKAHDYYDRCLEIDSDFEPAKRGISAVVRAMDGDIDDGSPNRSKDETREEMIVAAAMYHEGKYNEAILRLMDLKERESVSREASMLLGMAFARKGLYKRAYHVFLEFIRSHSPDILVLYNLGLALNRMGSYQEASNYLLEALARDDEYFEALLELGYAFLMDGHISDARDVLFQANKVDKEDPRPYIYLAKIAYDRQDRKKVAEFFKNAMGLDANCIELNYIRGYIAIHEQKPAEARDYLEAFLTLAHDHFDAIKLVGRAYAELGDQDMAAEYYHLAATLNPQDPECRQFLKQHGN